MKNPSNSPAINSYSFSTRKAHLRYRDEASTLNYADFSSSTSANVSKSYGDSSLVKSLIWKCKRIILGH